jgi:hypothetical protein
MMNRSLSFAAAVGALVLAGLVPHQASALPGAGVAETQAQPALVREVASKYNRRYYRDNGTYVRAPFAEVDTRRDTWVAAPSPESIRGGAALGCGRPSSISGYRANRI